MDNKAFRAAFPEFSDVSVYPDASLTFEASIAETMMDPTVWGLMFVNAVMLRVAHEVTIAGQNAKAGTAGGTPGNMSGPIQSKQVGSVNATYDTQATTEKGAGYWNTTTYGKKYWRLVQIYGAGVLTF